MQTDREFWQTDDVPGKTGAVNAVGTSDLEEVLAAFDLSLKSLKVLDVGCGTGRLAPLCGEYVGADVAPSQVQYALDQGLDAYLIDGSQDLKTEADIICCFSVFTHCTRRGRQFYLRKFIEFAPQLVVDILPGEEGGTFAAWYANYEDFIQDMFDAGYRRFRQYDRYSPDGYDHRYFHAW